MQNDPRLTVGHGMGYELSKTTWAKLKAAMEEALVDSITFGASAAVQRIHTVIRDAAIKQQELLKEREP